MRGRAGNRPPLATLSRHPRTRPLHWGSNQNTLAEVCEGDFVSIGCLAGQSRGSDLWKRRLFRPRQPRSRAPGHHAINRRTFVSTTPPLQRIRFAKSSRQPKDDVPPGSNMLRLRPLGGHSLQLRDLELAECTVCRQTRPTLPGGTLQLDIARFSMNESVTCPRNVSDSAVIFGEDQCIECRFLTMA